MFCPRCGKEIGEGLSFCSECGYELVLHRKEGPPERERPDRPQAPPPPTSEKQGRAPGLEGFPRRPSSKRQPPEKAGTAGKTPREKKPTRNRKKVFIAAVAVVVIAAVVAGGLYLFVFRKPGSAEDEIGQIRPFDPENVVEDPETGLQYVADEIIVGFQEGVTRDKAEEQLKGVNGTVVGWMDEISIFQVQLDGKKSLEELEELRETLAGAPSVQAVSLNGIYKSEGAGQTVPNDPKWLEDTNDTWDESNPRGYNWSLEAIKAPSAWFLLESEKTENGDAFEPVSIGVCDPDPLWGAHEDLGVPEENIHRCLIPIPWDEDTSHANRIAGIIGAEADNGVGITGVAWDRNLYAFQARTWYGEMWGVGWLTNKGVRIINISSGNDYTIGIGGEPAGGIFDERQLKAGLDDKRAEQFVLYSLFLDTDKERLGDFLVVHSAGNTMFHARYNGGFCSLVPYGLKYQGDYRPELTENVIIVGAVEQAGGNSYSLTDYVSDDATERGSNYGPEIDVVAPGATIYSTVKEEDGSGNYVSGYDTADGTSFAAPLVAGVAAMVWEADPELTAAEVKRIVVNTADTVIKESRTMVGSLPGDATTDEDDSREYRLINAEAAVRKALGGEPEAEEGMVFVRDGDIHTLNPGDGSVEKITSNGCVTALDVAEGSNSIYYATADNEDPRSYTIERIRQDGSGREVLGSWGYGQEAIVSVSVGPSEDTVYFSFNAHQVSDYFSDARALDVKTGEITVVSPIIDDQDPWEACSMPAVCPSGNQLACMHAVGKGRPGESGGLSGVYLCLMDTNGQNARDIFELPAGEGRPVCAPCWSPDGSRIAFVGESAQVWSVSSDGTDPKQLTSTSEDCFDLDWSSSGRKIAFCALTGDNVFGYDKGSICSVPSTGGEADRMVSDKTDSKPHWIEPESQPVKEEPGDKRIDSFPTTIPILVDDETVGSTIEIELVADILKDYSIKTDLKSGDYSLSISAVDVPCRFHVDDKLIPGSWDLTQGMTREDRDYKLYFGPLAGGEEEFKKGGTATVLLTIEGPSTEGGLQLDLTVDVLD